MTPTSSTESTESSSPRSPLDRHYSSVGVPTGAIDRAFLACNNRAVPSFGREYFQRNRAELDGVLKLAGGSKALAGFQSFGAFERLKSLYSQRWSLKRRLASLRISRSA